MTKPGHFEICSEMAKRNMDIRISLLENVVEMKLTHKGKDTNVTIGVYGNVIGEIMSGKLIGGLLLCNKEQYFSICDEMKRQGSQPTEQAGDGMATRKESRT